MSLESVLAEATAWASDRRTHLCDLRLHESRDGAAEVRGTVLDSATLATVLAELSQRASGIAFDASAVRVLAGPGVEHRIAGVAVADVHSAAAHAASVLTQLLMGDSVELLDERDGWSFVRLSDGYLGWVASTYLERGVRPEPTHWVTAPFAVVRAAADDRAGIEGRLAIGTRVRVVRSDGRWAAIGLGGVGEAWISATDLTPIDAPPPLSERASTVVEFGRSLIGVPYLWGGVTAFGIDCSGLVRLCHALGGIDVPRDADWQRAASTPVEPPYRVGDLLFFGEPDAHRAVSHVGLYAGDGRLIHASRTHAGVAVDALDRAAWLTEMFVGAGSFCR